MDGARDILLHPPLDGLRSRLLHRQELVREGSRGRSQRLRLERSGLRRVYLHEVRKARRVAVDIRVHAGVAAVLRQLVRVPPDLRRFRHAGGPAPQAVDDGDYRRGLLAFDCPRIRGVHDPLVLGYALHPRRVSRLHRRTNPYCR